MTIRRPYGIACFGTSLTTGRLSGFWPTKLERALRGVATRPVIVYDTGQGSQNSDWGLANVKRPANHRPDLALFEPFDINDSVAAGSPTVVSVAQGRANKVAILAALRASNPNVVVACLTMNGVPDMTLRPNLEDYYNDTRAFAAAEGLPLIDIRNAWGTPNYIDTPDGLHPVEYRVDQVILPMVTAFCTPYVTA